MKSYERYPGENSINPTPPPGAAILLPSELETNLAELTPPPQEPRDKPFTPLYAPSFYGVKDILLRHESVQHH